MFALETGGRRPNGFISAGIAFQYRDIEQFQDLLPGHSSSHSRAPAELLGAGSWRGHLHAAAHAQVDALTPLALPQMLAIRKA